MIVVIFNTSGQLLFHRLILNFMFIVQSNRAYTKSMIETYHHYQD